MSKPSLSSLLSQVTELTTQFAALSARLDTLPAVAPAAPAAVKQKQTRVKKEKDPDAVKRAPTAFFAFCASERAKTPEIKLKATDLSMRWKTLSADQQGAYKTAPAAPAVPAAAVQKPTFQEVRDIAAKMTSSVAAKFLRFCAQNPTLDAKTAEARWKALAPEQKAKFNDTGDDTSDAESSDDDDE